MNKEKFDYNNLEILGEVKSLNKEEIEKKIKERDE